VAGAPGPALVAIGRGDIAAATCRSTLLGHSGAPFGGPVSDEVIDGERCTYHDGDERKKEEADHPDRE
jgi:hypothetical protein